jgi:hypothetical protein
MTDEQTRGGSRALPARWLRSAISIGALLLGASACEDTPQSAGRGSGASTPAAAGAAGSAAAEGPKERELLVFKDETFVESIRNRDPFRIYAQTFRSKAPEEMQRRVLMPTTAVEEMELIGIITGLPRPKAMLLDPSGMGHVVERGDYVGRPKVIQATGSVSMALNWRVDRIRENEVVLTQQDPADPTRTGFTKIITLREEVAKK